MSEIQEILTTPLTHIEKIEKDSTSMKIIDRDVTDALNAIPAGHIYGNFITDMILSEIHETLHFYKCDSSSGEAIICELDPLNGLFIPAEIITHKLVPSYAHMLIISNFDLPGGIRDILDAYANRIGDVIERETISASEQSLKDETYGVKTTDDNTIMKIIETHIEDTINEAAPLEECHICGDEAVHTFYTCRKCEYAFCDECCKNIASRQATCPCCSKEFALTRHICCDDSK